MLDELAKEVLAMLDGQQEYFAAKKRGDPEVWQLLRASENREKRLRRICNDILKPPPPTLFTGGVDLSPGEKQ